jgi:predicted RecB family nuclease
LEHFEFLAEDEEDPRPAFLDSLIDTLGKRGLIVAYNAGFESQRLGDLANWMPKYAGKIAKIQARLLDLWPIVKKHVYHPRFQGSFSLKAILPALVPEMTYEGMEIAEGAQAGLAWETFVHGQLSQSEKTKLRAALLAYCRQDTEAMVRICEALKQAASREGNRSVKGPG